MKILILGGTKFLGRHLVDAALAHGHEVTLFNRGKTDPNLFPNLETIIGDRAQDIEMLSGREWDAVIDVAGYVPRIARLSAQALEKTVKRYVFISSISVYADFKKAGMDESYPVGKLEDESVEEITGESYGPLKALSEQETEKWFPQKSLIVRPGLIVGPRDETDRFTYWPVRIDRGGEVLAPGNPSDPVQFIDGRDLAEWTIRMVEKRESGIYNATGPAKELGIGGMLDGIKAALDSNARFAWASADFLKQQKVEAWSDMPVWAGDELGMARTNISRALAKGLTFRPLADTARDTLAWFKAQKPERQANLRAGLAAEREKQVLSAWHEISG